MATEAQAPATASVTVRDHLVDALRLDLIGPAEGLGDPAEVLPQSPSRWYLTGFLVPTDSPDAQKSEPDADDEVDSAGGEGADEDTPPELAAVRQKFLPSSMGLSVLVPAAAASVSVSVRWGDYRAERDPKPGSRSTQWRRSASRADLRLDLGSATPESREVAVPGTDPDKATGLVLAYSARRLDNVPDLPAGARVLGVFLVNHRAPAPDIRADEAFAFQAEIELSCETPFLARPDLRGAASEDWDERVADLQYRATGEFAVGHNIATNADAVGGECHRIITDWLPLGEVEHVEPAPIEGVELGMDRLAEMADLQATQTALNPMVSRYREWLREQAAVELARKRQRETAEQLLREAGYAAERITRGIAALAEADILTAFRLTNRVMAESARRRLGVMQGKPPDQVQPAWRPFQLAFLLMNLPALARPEHEERNLVDLLFFPTGGGKTEAYLGLAAFTLLLRRLRAPSGAPGQPAKIASAGVSVLMRYTLRLLTLDQLSRAATLICALELERQRDAELLGDWPFEIGLWVGQGATPNYMGRKGDNSHYSARAKTIAFQHNTTLDSPIPLENCPWCGEKFTAASFCLLPKPDAPTDLRINCANHRCAFSGGNFLPVVAVDEPIYRRLPCFLIATVDKFAALPWTGRVGALFGHVDRCDKAGFYGPCDPAQGAPLPSGLRPPDLIIQDELHLISGPLGTMAGLYETAIDALCAWEVNGRLVGPKIIASTATIRRAQAQIRALFNRREVAVFPPPGPDRRDSFFAQTAEPARAPARLYLGVAAPGRSPKVAMLRVYLALLAAAQKWRAQFKSVTPNPADPYLTLVGYFNSLRELGGSRRLVEDEIRSRLSKYADRKRVSEAEGHFADRNIAFEPVELTSRVGTAEVAKAKRRLASTFEQKDAVDVALATNMISVGVDIPRLGLMVVFGQPKTTAEYIQATSRIGRDPTRPGLVVTIFNVHRPRDRSHYERFAAYHAAFYRQVEASSITPFSPRAMDRGLAGALVGLARHADPVMTPFLGAQEILAERVRLDSVCVAFADRARDHADVAPARADRVREATRQRCIRLLDLWAKIAAEYQKTGTKLQYNPSEAGAAKPLLYDVLSHELRHLPAFDPKLQFKAHRSLRDVEPETNLRLKRFADLASPAQHESDTNAAES